MKCGRFFGTHLAFRAENSTSVHRTLYILRESSSPPPYNERYPSRKQLSASVQRTLSSEKAALHLRTPNTILRESSSPPPYNERYPSRKQLSTSVQRTRSFEKAALHLRTPNAILRESSSPPPYNEYSSSCLNTRVMISAHLLTTNPTNPVLLLSPSLLTEHSRFLVQRI